MKQPDILPAMTDDQGYGVLTCTGSTDFVTPHFDPPARGGASRRADIEIDRERI